MAVLDTNTTLFSADGSSDPKVGFQGVTISREVDFGITPVSAGVNYELIGLPDGFVALALGVEELESCGSAGTVTAKEKNDSATLGTAVSVGGTSPAKRVDTLSKACNGANMLCIVSSVAQTAGRVRVSVSGVLPNSDTRYSPELAEPWRKIGNTTRNVAEPDRLR